MCRPGKGNAPQDCSLRACILQEAYSLHINLLLDRQLPLLLKFSLSEPMIDQGWGLGGQSVHVQKATYTFV